MCFTRRTHIELKHQNSNISINQDEVQKTLSLNSGPELRLTTHFLCVRWEIWLAGSAVTALELLVTPNLTRVNNYVAANSLV